VKVICCVRNPAWILDSFESIYRKNPFEYSRLFTPAARMTVYSRCDHLIQPAGLVGGAWGALRDAYYSQLSEHLLLIDYDLLAQQPERSLAQLYDFSGEPLFAHDFENVDDEEAEYDVSLGVSGLHRVRRRVEFIPRRSMLPPQ